MFVEQLPDELQRTAYPLEEFGVYEYAWSYEEVKKVIIYLAHHTYAILGGDVWRKEGTSFISTYDGWYLNYNPQISWEEYIEKSKDKALIDIDFYHNRNGEDYYYVPVASLTKVGKP